MLKIIIEIIAVVALIVLGIFVFIKLLPWIIGILAVVGTIFEIYRRWFRKNGGGLGAPQQA
jgi:TM2 domain-containing membrane protein YozV